jgi:hypothetical protein
MTAESSVPRAWAIAARADGECADVIATRGAHGEDGAAFDATRAYCYAWWRSWRMTGPRLLVIALHPNGADEARLDQTSRLCREWARRLGYGSIIVGNLFAFRAATFDEVRRQEDPIGLRNDYWLARLHRASDATIVAWGTMAHTLTGRASCSRRSGPPNQQGRSSR